MKKYVSLCLLGIMLCATGIPTHAQWPRPKTPSSPFLQADTPAMISIPATFDWKLWTDECNRPYGLNWQLNNEPSAFGNPNYIGNLGLTKTDSWQDFEGQNLPSAFFANLWQATIKPEPTRRISRLTSGWTPQPKWYPFKIQVVDVSAESHNAFTCIKLNFLSDTFGFIPLTTICAVWNEATQTRKFQEYSGFNRYPDTQIFLVEKDGEKSLPHPMNLTGPSILVTGVAWTGPSLKILIPDCLGSGKLIVVTESNPCPEMPTFMLTFGAPEIKDLQVPTKPPECPCRLP